MAHEIVQSRCFAKKTCHFLFGNGDLRIFPRAFTMLPAMEFAFNRRSRLMTPRRSTQGVTMLQALALVMFGASLGAAARFLITHYSSDLSHHHGFPLGTLIVNVLG